MPRKTRKRKRKGGGRKEDVAAVMKEVLPEIPAERVAKFEEIIPRRFNFRSQDRKWRREDEFRAYHQNPKNIGLGFPFTAEQVVRYYADGFRNSEVRPDGLEKTLPGDTKEWYMLLPGGGWGNHPHEREGPFSANEIGDSIFTNTKLVDRSIPEENWRPQTLSAYLRGEGRREGPRTTLGFRPAGALHALRTERDRFERGWLRGGKKRKTRKRKGGGRLEDIAAVMKEWQPVEGKPPLPDIPAQNIANKVVEREPRDPPQLTSSQWLELKGSQRVRGIAFQIETPTTIIFNSRLNPSDMSKIKLKFPPEPLGSIAPLIPKRGDRVVAVDNNPIEDIKYLLGTVTSATKPRGQPVTEGFTLKIRTPVEYDTGPGPMPAASLNLNKNNFRIKVINEETPRPGPPLLDGFRFGGRRGNKTRKRKGAGGDDDKHDEKAVESEMLGWKPGCRVLPDNVADIILLQRKILMLEDAIKATTKRPRYPYSENGLESFKESREYPNAHTESLHAAGKSVKLAVTKTAGSDAPERSGDSDYQKVMVAFRSPPDYETGAPKWLAGKDFVKNHPFLIGDTIYISAPSPNKEKYEQVLGKITNFEEKFIPYTEIPEGAIANIGVGTSLVPYVYDESYKKIRNEKGQPLAKYHDSVAEDMWPDPAHAAIVAKERAKNPPGMYVLEISYDSNRPPGDSGLIDKYNAFLYNNEPGVAFDYQGYGPYNAAQAYVYTKLADRKARLKELKAALAECKTGTTQKRSIPDDGSGAGPGKVKPPKGGRRRKTKRKRKVRKRKIKSTRKGRKRN